MICNFVASDWQRYGIRNVVVPMPFPSVMISARPHLWRHFWTSAVSWDWDLGHVDFPLIQGYRFDGASIPPRLAGFADPIAALPGSAVHDAIYESQAGRLPLRIWLEGDTIIEIPLLDATTGLLIPWDGANLQSDERRRARADAVYRAILLESHVTEMEAHAEYMVVRCAGLGAWDNIEPPLPVVDELIAVEERAV